MERYLKAGRRLLETGRAFSERGVVHLALFELLVFGAKQAWACLFGGAMLALIIATHLIYPGEAALARYDFLFLCALALQVVLLTTRLESVDEAKVILIFHIVGTAMEIFKTDAGSWVYPEENLFRIGGVPLFTGFMYAAVGSYIARSTRAFHLAYTNYPPLWTTVALSAAIYINFFSHHFVADMRWVLFLIAGVLFGRVRVYFTVDREARWMPLVVGFVLVALFIWIAENIGTFTGTWLYPGQGNGWKPVPLTKLGSWFLLMIISFVLVSLVHRPTAPNDRGPGFNEG